MRSRILNGVVLMGLAGAAGAVLAGSTMADSGHPGHGRDSGQVLVVSNTSGGVPDDSAFPGPGFTPGPGFSWGPGPHHDGTQACSNPSYTTIGAAVSAASSGDTIVVCAGVYAEDVVVPASKPLALEGIGNPIINASGKSNGVQVLASGTTIDGFTVAYATGEGILVGQLPGTPGTISNVTISDNTVETNDQGNPTGVTTSGSTYAECNGANDVPGDCGEGIHLLSADNSTVTDNAVTGNSGGILLSDENGPTSGNSITDNDVSGNAYDCGVTLAGHHAGIPLGNPATGPWSTVTPSAGGVFNNLVQGNELMNDGVVGQGGGVILATGAPGGAVYNNRVEDNSIVGNGLAGVTVHSHSPLAGENLSGNTIRDNTIGVNNLDGDSDFAGPPVSQADPSTTGVLVATAFNPITITIVHNKIENDTYGVWMTPNVTAATSSPSNTFIAVTTPIFTAP